MTSKTRVRLKVGVIGLGRLGSVYVRDLAGRIPETTVVAVADTNRALADQIAAQFDVPKAYGFPQDLIGDPNVDAVDWVERIPFAETRNYVQRVMENLLVYRHRFEGAPSLAKAYSRPAVAQDTASSTQVP